MEKCECYIHSLKQGETNVLGEATIIERIGDNDYLAEYNGVKCHAIYNPFAGRYFVDDVYGVIRSSPDRDSREIRYGARGRSQTAGPLFVGKEE